MKTNKEFTKQDDFEEDLFSKLKNAKENMPDIKEYWTLKDISKEFDVPEWKLRYIYQTYRTELTTKQSKTLKTRKEIDKYLGDVLVPTGKIRVFSKHGVGKLLELVDNHYSKKKISSSATKDIVKKIMNDIDDERKNKDVNKYILDNMSYYYLIKYNNDLIHELTNGKYTPSQLRTLAKEMDIPAEYRTSAKALLAFIYPEKSQAIAVADEMIMRGENIASAIESAKIAERILLEK